MKILFVVDSQSVSNPYVITLYNGLISLGVNVHIGLNEFWNHADEYDILHFQWPEAIFLWRKSISDTEVSQFSEQLLRAKKKGVKIIITCHNLKPHTITNKNVLSLYNIIYQNCDLFLHMGEFSLKLLQQEYPNAQHSILEHHIYDNIYTFNIPKEEAQNKLHLCQTPCCILCFGEFRTSKERQMIIQIKKILNNHEYVFCTPSFYRKKILCKNPVEIVKRTYYTLLYKIKGFHFKKTYLNTAETEQYFCAADILLLQRTSILNSGNLPMGFAAGKVVVGPNIGNVGMILKQTGNPTFNPNSSESIVQAIQKANELLKYGKGKENQNYAYKYWTIDKTTKQLLTYYKNILTKDI